MNFSKLLYSNVKGLKSFTIPSSFFFLALLLFFTACSKEEVSSPNADRYVLDVDKLAGNDETKEILTQLKAFEDGQLTLWRAGENTSEAVDHTVAIDNMEGLLNVKLSSGTVYRDEQFLTDSIDVPSVDRWTGGDVATIYEGIKTILSKQYNSIKGDRTGFRFVDISDVKVREDGSSVLFVTGNIGSVTATERALKKASHFVWGSAETSAFFCSVPAETQIATAFNFQKGCLSGNPFPPSGSVCGFTNIRTVAVNPNGEQPGVPVNLIFPTQNYTSGNTQAPTYPNEGQFVWHFDNGQDENCFSFLKTNNYVFNQLSVADGILLSAVKLNFGSSYRLIGESLLSEKRNIVFNGIPIVTYNAHLALIYYGRKIIIFEDDKLPIKEFSKL